MPEDNAGVSGTQPGAGQKPEEVSTQNKSVQEKDPNVKEDAKIQGDGTEEPSKKDLEGGDEDKQTPYHKIPAFQRQQRKIGQQSARMEEMANTIDKLLRVVESESAARKGEEYKPEKKEVKMPSPDEILDSEMSSLSAANDLSPEDEIEVEKIAKKYGYEVDGVKMYIPASAALQIFKDQGADGKPKVDPEVDDEGKPKTPSTRPSGSSGGEAKVGKVQVSKPGEKLTTDQIFARARQVLAGREES
jgi:hypothetical protein